MQKKINKLKPVSVYIGSGFIDSQLLFVIPIVHGYCKKKKICRLIFERPLSVRVTENIEIKNILSNYEVKVAHTYSKHQSIRFLKALPRLIKNIIPSLFLGLKVNRSILLKEKTWSQCQLLHAVWDQALQKANDGTIKLSYLSLVESALRVLLAIEFARFLVKDEKVKSAFLGHTVYAARGFLLELKRAKTEIFAHAANVFYKVPDDKDSGWSKMSRLEWDVILTYISNSSVDQFWLSRSTGQSSYQDANLASNKTENVIESTPKNVVLLHVFRDSPFNYIDRQRIFSDYVDWVEKTLKIIAKSDESWLLKTHPSALRWGENQQDWIIAIGKKIFKQGWPENIQVSNARHSNVELFKHATRIVTYHGTSHLEAACWGIKPIVVSDVTLNSYDANLTLKPSTLEEYAGFMLAHQHASIFKLSQADQMTARKLLFLREEVLTLARDVGAITTYRGDDEKTLKKDFYSVNECIAHCASDLSRAGEYLADGLSRTISLTYIDLWYQAFKNTFKSELSKSID